MHVNTGCAELDAGLARRLLREPARELRGAVPEPARAWTPPHALHRLERLGEPAAGRARARHPARHQLLLLAAGLGARPARLLHRLGHADALRRRRTAASSTSTRPPTQMTDESGSDLSRSRSTRCSTARSARRATTARSPRTCTPTATSDSIAGSAAIVASAQARGVPVVSARQMLDWLDGRNASTPRRLRRGTARRSTSRVARHSARAQPAGAPAGEQRERSAHRADARRHSGRVHARDAARHPVRELRRGERQLRGDLWRRHDGAGDQRPRSRARRWAARRSAGPPTSPPARSSLYGTDARGTDLAGLEPGARDEPLAGSRRACCRARPTTTA